MKMAQCDEENDFCYRHMQPELYPFQIWFPVTDPHSRRCLDIQKTFAPDSLMVLLWKILYAVTCVGTMIWAMLDSTPYFYFAYLTNWGVLWCCIYSMLSLTNSLMSSYISQPKEHGTVPRQIRITWIMFALAIHGSAIPTVLFWTLVFDSDTMNVTYLLVAPHGILFALTCIDGMCVNRIPLRWLHWYGFVIPVNICFLLWSIVHDVLDIGNPNESDNDPTTNDDAIYPGVIEWNVNWQKTLYLSLFSIFVVGPIVFGILWSASRGCFYPGAQRYLSLTHDLLPLEEREEPASFELTVRVGA